MAAFKNKNNGTWFVQFRYTNWKGERKQKCKRGFPTKREALAWEREFLLQKQADVNMTFESFVELYEKDVRPKLKGSTWCAKESIIRLKILPYFGKRQLCEITPKDVIDWQNEMRETSGTNRGKVSPSYLKVIHAQLSCLFNHAVRYYGLQSNPANKAGGMGGDPQKEMQFWTKAEYMRFSAAVKDAPVSYHAFELLYWCGIRIGELLALTPADFDFDTKTLTINKSYQRVSGKDTITSPKTPKSNRTIKLPQFLCDEMWGYLERLYGAGDDDRIFPVSKQHLRREMKRGAAKAGVKCIRIHDIRHSHVSLLIDMGFSALAIADRVGHESINITYRYAHLFPSKQIEMADRLNNEWQKGKGANDR